MKYIEPVARFRIDSMVIFTRFSTTRVNAKQPLAVRLGHPERRTQRRNGAAAVTILAMVNQLPLITDSSVDGRSITGK
ncbi:MAG: hypothetical protein U1A77_07600 [Pirellulales bacterium]